MIAIKTYQTKNGLADLRLRLGLSQQAFARLLGISRSMLGHAENRNRCLPTTALIQLAALELSLQQQASPREGGLAYCPGLLQPQPVANALLQQHISALQVKLRSRQCELERMQRAHLQAQQCLAELNVLINAGAEVTSRFPPGSLELHRYALLRKLNRSGPLEQAHVHSKINGLRAALAEHHISAPQATMQPAMELVA